MAQVESTNIRLKINTPSALTGGVSITNAIDGCLVDYRKSEDGKILIMLQNTGATEVTTKILKGNALQGTRDLEIKIGGNSTEMIVVESGRFVNAFGEKKGKLVINGSTAVKVSVVELP